MRIFAAGQSADEEETEALAAGAAGQGSVGPDD